jgi:triacylglycerol lipase
MPSRNSSVNPVALRPPQAAQVVFKSQIDRSMRELSENQRALLSAELCLCSFYEDDDYAAAIGRLGFQRKHVYEYESFHVSIIENNHDTFVVVGAPLRMRWEDFEKAVNLPPVPSESVGQINPVFKDVADHLWPEVECALSKNLKPLWFAGHSLGGAVADVLANRCLTSHIKSEPQCLYTFGSPRVGCRKYVNYLPVNHQRWIHNDDGVTFLPPARLGYQHGGTEMRIDSFCRLNQPGLWHRTAERIKGTYKTFVHSPQAIQDHAICGYVDAIFEAVLHEEKSSRLRTH